MARPRERFKHVDCGHNVMIDRFPLCFRQGSAGNCQVRDLVFSEELRYVPGRIRPAILNRDLAHLPLRLRWHELTANVVAPQKLAILIYETQLLAQTAKDIGEDSILSRAGGAPTLAVGMAYSSVVAAELFNGLPGVGGLVKDASNYNNTPVVLVGIFAIGFSGLIIDGLLRAAERRAVPWRGKI